MPIRPPTPPSRAPLVRCAMAGWLALALAACVSGPDYQRPEVALPATWRAEPAAPADVVNTAWWEAFGDADLNALIRVAIDENKDLRIAALRIAEFDGRLQISRAARLPQLGYGASAGRTLLSEERPVPLPVGTERINSSFEFSLNAGWELDLWGRVQRANEAARADLLATEEARRAVMLSLVSSVATSYVQLLSLDQQLLLVQRTLKNRGDALALLDTKYRGGSASRLVVAQARSALEEVAAVIPDLERQRSTLENALSQLIGRLPGPVKRGSLADIGMPPVPQGVPSDVLVRRPDVLAAEQALVAANARIGMAKAAYFPVISLTGVLGGASTQLSRIFQDSAQFGDLGVGLLGALFDGGRIEGAVRQTEAVQQQMVQRYLQAIQTALREVEDALVFRQRTGQQAAAVGRQTDALADAAGLARKRYDGGYTNYLEVLDAERQLFAAERQLAQSRRDTYVSLVAVYKAMGGGWMAEQDRLREAVPATAAAAVASTERSVAANHEKAPE